ncbi:methyltransferase [Massilia endophytica]|uniref:methyltransferase n=1 Tax=Massilia endophytica TaxID=2899220 RepID=UPI001E5D6626|nr:methyltransferase [Massilia endophytica]UGQ48655.1 methyltransferase [Massilia endophytica]
MIRPASAQWTASANTVHRSAPQAALLELGRDLIAAGYRFTTVTPATHARIQARCRRAWARDLCDIFGWSMPFRADALPPRMLKLMLEAGIAWPHGEGWRPALRASELGGRLYFHSAYPTSEADAVFFGPDTYRFTRALRAELAAMAARGVAVERAADIGAGAGPGAAEAALCWPDAEVLALDINDQALSLCEVNMALARLPNVAVRHSDLLSDVAGEFDLLVSNPPYLLDGAERRYRHGGGELGTGLSCAILEQALKRLAPGGSLLLYTGVAMVRGEDPFLRRAAPMLEQAGFRWSYEEIDPDVFGEELDEPAYREAERIAAVWLKATRPQH